MSQVNRAHESKGRFEEDRAPNFRMRQKSLKKNKITIVQGKTKVQ